ncbi:TrmB family transcriptional regulator [Streptosporangium sp. NPDC004379]|uniref:TrmB family transcriptional regulator n=1 Tax=Streptosporangium sp. NPDC004379 TaxID=3366189 RepID=UPI003693AF5B
MRDVVEQLQRLGMSGYEAKAYVTLVGAGRPLNGYEVAKRSGVPRSTVYETLGKLVSRGAAYELHEEEGVVGYQPLPPAALLERMRREFDDSMESLQSSLPTIAAPPEVPPTHNLRDAESLLTRAGDVVAAARSSLLVAAWPEETARLSPLVRRAAKRGVEVSETCSGTERGPVGDATGDMTGSGRDAVGGTAGEDAGSRLLVVVGDRREALIGGLANGAGWGVYTQDRAVVLLAERYIAGVRR